MLVTDVSTTWAVVIFRVRVVIRWWYLCLWSWFQFFHDVVVVLLLFSHIYYPHPEDHTKQITDRSLGSNHLPFYNKHCNNEHSDITFSLTPDFLWTFWINHNNGPPLGRTVCMTLGYPLYWHDNNYIKSKVTNYTQKFGFIILLYLLLTLLYFI